MPCPVPHQAIRATTPVYPRPVS